MKEASGELNMTVVTIVAIAAVAAFFTYFMWPRIQQSISDQWGNVSNSAAADHDYSSGTFK